MIGIIKLPTTLIIGCELLKLSHDTIYIVQLLKYLERKGEFCYVFG
jgi:hypothetical protein